MSRVGFLGPHGTFAEEALLSQPDLAAGTAVPFRDVPHVITAVERGDVDLGVVPIENSIEGSVTVTLDTLAFDTELLVQREVDLPVALQLCARPGTRLADVHTVISHPNPLGQTRLWMAKHLPDAVTVAANSTADAALQVAKSRKSGIASIGTKQGAKHAGLSVLARDIEDHPDNETRFVLVGFGIPEPSGHDKTSVVCFQRADRPGSLLAILQEFAARRDQPHEARVAPHEAEPRRLLLLHRLRRPSRRRVGRRLPPQPGGEAGEGEVPRLIPGCRR